MRYGWLMMALVLAGCGDTSVGIVDAERVFDPPAVVFEAYAWAEDCTGLRGDASLVRWYRTAEIRDHHGDRQAGAWVEPHDIHLMPTIWRALAQEPGSGHFRIGWRVVVHEAIHDLTQTGEHPAAYAHCDPLTS